MKDEFANELDALDGQVQSVAVESLDDFNPNAMQYERFIVLSKKELSDFLKVVEPMTKTAIDDYSKSIHISSTSDYAELRYINKPASIAYQRISNKSEKGIKSFCVSVSILKKIVTTAFESVVFVEDEKGQINLVVCQSAIYLETKALDEKQYDFEVLLDDMTGVDVKLAEYVYSRVGSMLALSDRASEKCVIHKSGKAIIATSYFNAEITSPFQGGQNFIAYKSVVDVISTMASLAKVSLTYKFKDDVLCLCTNSQLYVEVSYAGEEKIAEFLPPSVEYSLSFNNEVNIASDQLARLIAITSQFEYLSDIVKISFTKEHMTLTLNSTNMTKQSTQEFPIVEGIPTKEGSINIQSSILKQFFQAVGVEVTYDFTEDGIGVKNNFGKFILRRS